jgi:hypothetical protein
VTFGDYLAGSLELIVVAAAIAFAAVRLRGRLLPGWSGASARLAEVVLGLSLLVVVLELVGVVGLYRPGWVLAGALLAGVGVGLAVGRPGEGSALPAPAVAPYALAIAVAAALLVAAHWAMPTQVGLDIGMYLPNTTWHNAPFAARFVEDAQVGALHFTEVLRLTVWFYPQNSELLHSAGVLFLGNDFLSPLINIGWMALCLLAAWSFGRAYGAGAAAVLALALVLDANMLLLYQPGDAKNDTAGLFFLLASAAILVNAEAQRRAAAGAARPIAGGAPEAEPPARAFHSGGPALRAALPTGALVVAGLAAGLALGTKLNLLAPFGLLTLGVIAVTAGYRVRATLVWVASSLVTGGFWFARNLVEAGNPLPWLDKGPLPGPDQLDIDIREPHTVSDYLTDVDVIKDSFIPGLHESFGDLWPLILVAVIGGFLLAIFRGRTPITRMLGIVALFSGIAYLFTPLTAAGPLDHPTAFTTNLRYASPALGLGALLLAVDPWFDRGRIRDWLLAALAVLLLTQALPVWDLGDDVWERDFLFAGIVLAFFVVLVPVALALAGQPAKTSTVSFGTGRRQRRRVPLIGLLAGGALALAIVVGIGWRLGDDYLDHRYRAETAPSDFPEGTRAALAWFNEEDPHDARIAVVGGRPGFKQYVFYGDDLSNHVQYVARHGPHGAFLPIASEAAQKREDPDPIPQCQEWKRALNNGDYDYVVIGPDQRTQALSPVEAEWTGTDPAATELEESDMTFVFRLDGDLDPAGCPYEVSRPLIPTGAGGKPAN